MSITNGLKREIERARFKNRFRLIAQVADEIADSRRYETSLMVEILSGAIYNEAVQHVEYLRRKGIVDKMYMPTGK